MKISIITLFPEMFPPILDTSILKRAQNKGLFNYALINLRDFGLGIHQQVDDRPYGGGAGMLLKADVLAKAVQSINPAKIGDSGHIPTILMSASGTLFTQNKAQELATLEELIIVCGHYEGVDQRFIDHYIDQEISIGDFVLTGGELPAMILSDSLVRLISGVLEKPDATKNESFTDPNLLEYPHYTRPDEFEGVTVPEILKSGNHAEIEKWKQTQAQTKTQKTRPDLIK